MPESEHRPANKGPAVIAYTCVGLTGTAALFVCVHLRNRAPVSAAGTAGSDPDHRRLSVDVAKLPEFAYTYSASHSGGDAAQCSVCLGEVQAGEMVRLLPMCKHLYHVECIDMWLASHTTCPLCRSVVEPPAEGQPTPTGNGGAAGVAVPVPVVVIFVV